MQFLPLSYKNSLDHPIEFLCSIYEGKDSPDLHTCLFACFLSQEEPKRVSKALSDPAWVEAMQEELLQFKLQNVWVLVDLPKGHRAIGTKWVYRNKKDERGIVVRNKARNLLAPKAYTRRRHLDQDIHGLLLCMCKVSFKVSPNTSHLDSCQKDFKIPQRKPSLAMQETKLLVATSSTEVNMWLLPKLLWKVLWDPNHLVDDDLLTKGFDAGRFQYLVSSIGMLNP
ncbi:putative ribonuclease H-like domain-containing protein [Tanacetum coccineum]